MLVQLFEIEKRYEVKEDLIITSKKLWEKIIF